MTPVARRRKKDEIKISIGLFHNYSDYTACVEIQREAWRYEDLDIVSVPMLLATDRSGGISLGAYNSLGEMIGFVSSILGMEDGELLYHSHMLAVRVAYRNFDVGYRLKLALRKEALKRKIHTITWAIDPMQPLNAYFSLGKLGSRAGTYEENLYGETTSHLHRGLPTDRFLARWDLTSRSVEHRLESGPPRHDIRKELKKYVVVNHLEEVAPGMTTSSPIKTNCSDAALLFEVPYNLPEIKNRNLGVALEWQGKMRQVFKAYFRKGYAATDFWMVDDDGHLRTFYFLQQQDK